MSGLFFEEFEEGKEFNHALSHAVTEMGNVMFSTMSPNRFGNFTLFSRLF